MLGRFWMWLGDAAAPAVPDAPSGLSVQSTTNTEALLEWSANDITADSQEIQYSTDPAFSGAVSISGISAIAEGATVSGLNPNRTYYFRVRAVNGAGNSDWSNTASGTTSGSGGHRWRGRFRGRYRTRI